MSHEALKFWPLKAIAFKLGIHIIWSLINFGSFEVTDNWSVSWSRKQKKYKHNNIQRWHGWEYFNPL